MANLATKIKLYAKSQGISNIDFTQDVKLQNDNNDIGSLFRLDGLAIQEGDYYSTYIGPEEVRKTGQIAWRTND